MRVLLCVVMVTAVVSPAAWAGECVALEAEHLPEVVGSVRFGATTADEARRLLAGDGIVVEEQWDSSLGGETTVVVEGLASMTPNLGLQYGEISFRSGAANLDQYRQIRLRFARDGGAEPVLYWLSVTTRVDDEPSVCAPARSLAERLSEQERPDAPPALRRPRATDSGYTFYPCLEDDRTVIVRCDDGGVKVSLDGVRYPLRTVEYELLVGR
jgi:hypothetical protein